MRLAVMVMVMVMVAAPSWGASHKDPPATIIYTKTGAGLCLVCATYSLTLKSDGRGVFAGERNTGGTDRRPFKATAAQARAFRDRLAPFRPHGERLLDRSPPCHPLSTDQDTVEVRWQGPNSSSRLVYYGGCDAEANRDMANALFSASDLLPIASFLAKR